MSNIRLTVRWGQDKDRRTIPVIIRASDQDGQMIEVSITSQDGPEPLYTYESRLHGDKDFKKAPKLLTFHEAWAGIATNLGIEADLHKG